MLPRTICRMVRPVGVRELEKYAPIVLSLLILLISASVNGAASAASPPPAGQPPVSSSRPAEPAAGEAPASAGDARLRAGSFLPLDPFHAGLTIGSGVGWFTEDATAQGLGKMGPTLHFSAILELYDLFTGAVSVGTIFVKDKSNFSQGVMDAMGNTFDANSSINLTIVGLSGGLRTPDFCLRFKPDGKGWLAMNAFARYGHAWVSGSRSIENCKDCRSDPLELSGGQFVESGLDVGSKQGDGVGVSVIGGYRQYLGGASPSGEIELAFEISYW